MKKLFGAAICSLLFLGSILTPKGLAQTHQFIPGMMLKYFDYQETVPQPLKSTESGWLTGTQLAYVYSPSSNWGNLKVVGSWILSPTQYDGTTQSGVPVLAKTDNLMRSIEGQIKLNSGWSVGGATLSPVLGFEYASWVRALSSYTEHYAWTTASFGFNLSEVVSDQLDWSVTALARPMVGGDIDIWLSRSSTQYQDVTLPLGNMWGGRIESQIQYRFSKIGVLSLTGHANFSQFGQSPRGEIVDTLGTVHATVYEPASTTIEAGVQIGLRFQFGAN